MRGQDLIRKRVTRTIEGTTWMVLACAAAVWLIVRPGDLTNWLVVFLADVTGILGTRLVRLPERILLAETTVEGMGLTAVSYHAPPGVNWGIDKARQAVAFSRLPAGRSSNHGQ